MKILLDYGHGGLDAHGNYTTAPSKQAMVNGEMVHEGVINRIIGRMLFFALQFDGYDVHEIVKAEDPTDVSLQTRVNISNQYDGAIFVSIHCNAFNGNARGFEVWTTRGQNNSDILAQSIIDEVKGIDGLPMRFDPTDGDEDKEAGFKVIRDTKHPAVLVECLFFDNAEDLALYEDKEWLKEFVVRLYKGIANYVNSR